MWRRGLLAAAFLTPSVVGAVAWTGATSDAKSKVGMALAVTAVFTGVVLLLLEVAARGHPNANRKRFGYLEIVLGSDGRFSTSKAMAAAWTLVFSSALVLLGAMVWRGAMTPDDAFGTEWDPYLLLLGGPFAAAVLAKAITSHKAEEGLKTTTSAASSTSLAADSLTTTDAPTLSDLSRNDAGDLSLPDTQYWIFSLVAVIYFVGAFVAAILDYAAARETTLGLPEIPPALLGLTSLAALTYVGAKAVATEGVRLASVQPNPAQPGDDLTISVVNVADSVQQGQITIRFTAAGFAPIDHAPTTAPSRVGALTTFSVEPPGVAGQYEVVVITPYGTSAAGRLTVS